GEPEGVVDQLIGQQPSGTYAYARLTDGRTLPFRWLCLDPKGHVFARVSVTGEPNLCLSCGCEIIVPADRGVIPPYSGDQETERDA
ncbi:MAG: hypothetical protein ACHP8B_18150, partial [Terriglobales bacterium]